MPSGTYAGTALAAGDERKGGEGPLELSADELADIRAKAEKASPGLWTRDDVEIRDGRDRTIGEMMGPESSDKQDARNAAHVVSAQPATVMRLVDMITARDVELRLLSKRAIDDGR